MYSYQVIDIEGWGYGYVVTAPDGSRLEQNYKPGVPGRVRMTQSEAETYAQAVVAEANTVPSAE